ncbi:DEAD/DEAH box helicase [Sporomusa acidovorans]|uniref:RNA polymerase-associated protein RapA n=1 Tax=Sporomusa acidovorans (strain ATCC 49682 / DSM 3132 / Mol) TaxID=1123286 RepID=A0ABZ3J213_SPOA4|nr:DEAD/DEAH box helicase [Sporomusa acidovorans]OZC14991.1 bacterial SNF2 helicase associated [Sporomusa acidovorans DSM 3132]SDE83573.1 Superfamily II DNA or RNA helicase, SNF2 family [Sporomusa acidovorans]
MLADEIIRAEAESDAAYMKGCHYYYNNCVDNLHLSNCDNTFEARVRSQYFYIVSVTFNGQQKIKQYSCDCPAFHSNKGACKHIVAVLKAIQHVWPQYFGILKPVPLTQTTRKLLDFFQNQAIKITSDKKITACLIKLTPIYGFSGNNTRKTNYVEFTIGSDRMYVVKDIPQLLSALDTNQEIIFGKNLTIRPQHIEFDDLSAKLITLLRQAYKEENERTFWYPNSFSGPLFHSAFSDSRQLKLTNTNLLRFLAAMGDQPFAVAINGKKTAGVRIINARPPVRLTIQTIKGGLKLVMDLADDEFYGLDSEFHYIYYHNAIYHVDTVFAQYLKQLLNCFSENRNQEVNIPATAVSEFVSATLPALETIATVTIESAVHRKIRKEELLKRVYLDKFAAGISARIEFCYGNLIIDPHADTKPAETVANDHWLLRSTIEEKMLLNIFYRHGFVRSTDKLVLAEEEAAYDFLQQALPELEATAEVFYSDAFMNMKLQPPGKITAGIRLNTSTDMLEFSLNLDDISPQELIELLAAYKLKKRYHRLSTGAFIPLDSPEFQTVAGLIEELGLRPADIKKQVVELPKYHALYLDSITREAPACSLERNSAFKRMVQDIREPQDFEYAVPAGIQGKLRDYQKTGVKWLKALAHYGLGGILADDMGLGKTLQVITFILAEKKNLSEPSLVIAPTTLIFNWQEEVAKFAPGLKALVICGQPAERLEQLKEIDGNDIIITSYALIKRDIAFYEKRNFAYCFLDEAQHIKNPNTLNARSVKQIKARSYFALTGTPIENTLTELWSIFDFLMPGYLRTHKVFTKRFEIPIVKNGDTQALKELGRHIKPFILRRMKKTVLKELPEKIESKMVSEMTAEQARLYTAWLLKARQEFETEISNKGFEKSQIKILSLLTRLRQICSHPSLFIENYQGSSGKLAMLQELIKDATGGGHRLLLFSQFTGMLAIIKEELTAMKISYHYLDGTTKAEDRIRLVNAFNAGEKDVFLISLKAGGTGLNLTGADMVIHYDPWWNPAVEDQATDRAYRIGQKNSVHVYKLITKNTIEEKIYLLQQKKKEIIDSLIRPGESLLTKMTEAEIRELFTV